MKLGTWEKTIWPFTDNKEILSQFDCYVVKRGRGKLYLLVYKEPYFLGCKYHYCSSFGANSDNNYSGLLGEECNNLTLEEAQTAVVKSNVRYIGA